MNASDRPALDALIADMKGLAWGDAGHPPTTERWIADQAMKIWKDGYQAGTEDARKVGYGRQE